jgi:hypothetical protein
MFLCSAISALLISSGPTDLYLQHFDTNTKTVWELAKKEFESGSERRGAEVRKAVTYESEIDRFLIVFITSLLLWKQN